ncbi:MAG TPA: hypothetical protein VK890_04000 [Bacteroidia bacterium]|jgi:hypothetical protein|nr:hypothetical protein [Bacteroidia bacterium]
MLTIRHLVFIFICLPYSGFSQNHYIPNSVLTDSNQIVLKFDSANSLVKDHYGSIRNYSVKAIINKGQIEQITELIEANIDGDCAKLDCYFINDTLVSIEKITAICGRKNDGQIDTTSYIMYSQAIWHYQVFHNELIIIYCAVDALIGDPHGYNIIKCAYEDKGLLQKYLYEYLRRKKR